jgi:rhamnose utilization protein RhaD (predicted bifunctional aldolase and dehydrogenase)
VIDQLLELTRALGQPHLNYVVIGEGNTSCRIDDVFYIKASGQQMGSITQNGFVGMRLAPVLALLDQDDPAQTPRMIEDAKVDSVSPLKPSVEVTFHAMLLAECGVRWIAHTHPVAVNRLLCSTRAEQFAHNRLFPDEAVLCGPESVFVPYADPGLPLARAIRTQTHRYMDKWGEAPKVILLANHGLIALGQTATDALNITAMCVKAAEIFAGACMVGEPVFMSQADILHIIRRPDEIYRRSLFVGATDALSKSDIE